jgi:hypothetical protein
VTDLSARAVNGDFGKRLRCIFEGENPASGSGGVWGKRAEWDARVSRKAVVQVPVRFKRKTPAGTTGPFRTGKRWAGGCRCLPTAELRKRSPGLATTERPFNYCRVSANAGRGWAHLGGGRLLIVGLRSI